MIDRDSVVVESWCRSSSLKREEASKKEPFSVPTEHVMLSKMTQKASLAVARWHIL
jgi:hypothetical protein